MGVGRGTVAYPCVHCVGSTGRQRLAPWQVLPGDQIAAVTYGAQEGLRLAHEDGMGTADGV